MKQSRICVVFTGGTIGSSSENKTVDLDGGSSAILINKYRTSYNEDVNFTEYYPISILSENVQISDIEKMTESVRNIDYASCDGIIVTHGTDTLCFTANYFSQIFADIPVPLVFVSALYPLGDKRSNGLDNFAAAVMFIKEGIRGVFVAFKNPGETCKIHLASRIVEADQLNGHFHSLLDVHFGEVIDGRFVYNTNSNNPSVQSLDLNSATPFIGGWPCNDVVVIRARALLDFSFYRFGELKPKAVIIQLYHSGTVCTAGWDTNFLTFLDYCRSINTEVVIAPVDSKANVYAGMLGIKDKCILSYDMSFEMTVVKVMLALGAGVPLLDLLEENRFFEKI